MSRTTIPMLGPGGVVVVEALESGAPGLVVARSPTSDVWVVVHTASGLVVSRSANHHDPEVLMTLVERLAPLADWTQRAIPVPGPVLRAAVDRAIQETGLSRQSGTRSVGGQRRSSEQDRDLLARVLRTLQAAVSPAAFAKAIAELDAQERARLSALLAEQVVDSSGVVTSLLEAEPRRSAGASPVPQSEPGTAAG
jgi:hypothetical protein